jgi:beta-dihydromenaquinone-9 omega-hydroxylase
MLFTTLARRESFGDRNSQARLFVGRLRPVAARTRMAVTLARTVGDGTRREARAALRGLRRVDEGVAAHTGVDPLDPAVARDPYPWYAAMHAGPPLHYAPARRTFVVAHYDAVRAAARAHDALSSAESITPTRASLPMMIVLDRPGHTRLRKLVARHFTRDAIERFRPAIEAIASAAVDDLLAAPETDAVAKLASPLPVDVIADVLGVPRADRRRFRTWSDRVITGFGLRSPRGAVTVLGATMRLHGYFDEAFARRRSAPSGDLLSHLVASDLDDEERFWFALLLLIAGNETTTNLLGGMMLAFAQAPEQYERVRADPALVPGAVEEALRWVSPIQGLYRTALADYAVGDATIPAGGRVLLLFGAANRDPRRFADPGRLDVGRDASDHVAFGSGIHFCLGAHLARLEGQAVLRALAGRVARIELAGAPEWNDNPSLRGLARLPVRCVPAPGG